MYLQAAHIISTVRATLRGAAHRELPPHAALECSNTLLCPEMTEGMSLRCLYAIISPQTGLVHYASAG
ncbi:MAG: SpoIIE family protein phosphatase, partial [Chlorobiales bacterium]|nr:SpoIIE family protein phosphatase [Chlorobiales bacterium]